MQKKNQGNKSGLKRENFEIVVLFKTFLILSLQITFHVIRYRFQMCGIVVRQPCTDRSSWHFRSPPGPVQSDHDIID